MVELFKSRKDILIDVDRNIPTAVEYIQEAENHPALAISVITQLELIASTAIKIDVPFVTKNQLDFNFITGRIPQGEG
jgi:hypothetical protein